MPARPDGSRIVPVTCNRTLVLDILRLAVPAYPLEREVNLSRLARAREESGKCISWTALFMKAYGLVAREAPALRRVYLSWPYPRMYEHPHSVAAVTVARQYRGEPRLCWALIENPEERSLLDLQHRLDEYRGGSVKEMFLNQTRLSRAPWWIRRPIWWHTMHASGPRRVRQLGTFAMSILGNHGGTCRSYPILQTGSIAYSPPGPEGPSTVMVQGDHRVADGLAASMGLRRLEAILRRDLTQELLQIARQKSQAA